jgi:NAD(P)-dependent dehydrogenase (short-subunit alcohol dehydrogenase family)
MNLQGKIAIVTGGGSGYGLGIACALLQAGAKVFITGRNQAKLEAAAAANDLHAIVADASSGSDWDRVFKTVGGVDILVNNAGFGGLIAPVAEQDDAGIISTISTNLTGVILGCSRAAKIMTAQKSGIIINISSVCALYAWPGWSVYTAAKAGLSKFSHGLYTELRPHGVRVTCVTPSWGQTDFNKAANISGASEDAALASKCISPVDLGKVVLDIITTPAHLAIPDVTIQPMIQDISPM